MRKERMDFNKNKFNNAKSNTSRQIQDLQRQINERISVQSINNDNPNQLPSELSLGARSRISQMTNNNVLSNGSMFGGKNDQTNFRQRNK